MKSPGWYLLFCFLSYLLFSCTGKKQTQSAVSDTSTSDTIFKSIDIRETERINSEALARGIKTPEEMIQLYMPKETAAEGNYSYEITRKVLSKTDTEVTAVAEGLMDDSMKGRKVIMIVSNINGEIKVISIKETYKCYTGRGHEDWSPAVCN